MRKRLAEEQHEVSDASFRGAALNGLALSLIIAGIFIALAGLYHRFAAHNPIAGNSRLTLDQGLAPRLQVDEARDLARLRSNEDAVLNQYGWVDSKSNRVRVPIARAMELLVQQGLTTNGIEIGKTRLDMRQEKASAERGKR
ncbi:MAG: hypothetical protein JWM99_4180 [Verrucomicrobiales bacterium]|nr:hypothetical protein [Verrucomicrobiales bacterium]